MPGRAQVPSADLPSQTAEMPPDAVPVPVSVRTVVVAHGLVTATFQVRVLEAVAVRVAPAVP